MFTRKKVATTARLNVINKGTRPFEKVFYNSLNITNFPQADLQLSGGGIAGGTIGTGGNYLGGNCVGVNCLGGKEAIRERVIDLEPKED